MPTLQAIIFDFDGVIANTEPLHFAGLHQTLKEIGIELTEPEYYAEYLGYDDRGCILAALAANGVEVLADDFSLQERGISANRLIPGIKAAPLSVAVDQMADGRKALWH